MKLTSVCTVVLLATLTANAVAQESTRDDMKKLRGFLGDVGSNGR